MREGDAGIVRTLEEVFEAAAGTGPHFDNIDGVVVLRASVDEGVDGCPIGCFVRGVPAYDERVAPEVVEFGVAVCGVGEDVFGAGDGGLLLAVHCVHCWEFRDYRGIEQFLAFLNQLSLEKTSERL